AISWADVVAQIDGVGVPACFLDCFFEGADRPGLLFERQAQAAVDHPAVADGCHAPDELGPEVTAEQDWDAFAWAWSGRAVHAVEVAGRAVEGGGRLGPQDPAGLQLVVEDLAAALEGHADRVVLVLVPADRDAHHEPASRERMERRHLLCEQARR